MREVVGRCSKPNISSHCVIHEPSARRGRWVAEGTFGKPSGQVRPGRCETSSGAFAGLKGSGPSPKAVVFSVLGDTFASLPLPRPRKGSVCWCGRAIRMARAPAAGPQSPSRGPSGPPRSAGPSGIALQSSGRTAYRMTSSAPRSSGPASSGRPWSSVAERAAPAQRQRQQVRIGDLTVACERGRTASRRIRRARRRRPRRRGLRSGRIRRSSAMPRRAWSPLALLLRDGCRRRASAGFSW